MLVVSLVKNHVEHSGNSLVVQWLGLGASTAGGLGSIPGWGTKISQATQCSPPKKKNHVEYSKDACSNYLTSLALHPVL